MARFARSPSQGLTGQRRPRVAVGEGLKVTNMLVSLYAVARDRLGFVYATPRVVHYKMFELIS